MLNPCQSAETIRRLYFFGAYVDKLIRTRIGPYRAEDAVKFEALHAFH